MPFFSVSAQLLLLLFIFALFSPIVSFNPLISSFHSILLPPKIRTSIENAVNMWIFAVFSLLSFCISILGMNFERFHCTKLIKHSMRRTILPDSVYKSTIGIDGYLTFTFIALHQQKVAVSMLFFSLVFVPLFVLLLRFSFSSSLILFSSPPPFLLLHIFIFALIPTAKINAHKNAKGNVHSFHFSTYFLCTSHPYNFGSLINIC